MARPLRCAPKAESTPDSWESQAQGVLVSGVVASNQSPSSPQQNPPDLGSPDFPIAANVSVVNAPGVVPSSGWDGQATSRDVMTALSYGLELVRHGAMLVAPEGKPHLANRAALAILDKKDGISLARTGLVAERASDTRLLHRLLQDAITAPERGEPKDSPIALQRKNAHSTLIVRVVPGPGVDCWPDQGNRTALVKLYDLESGVAVDERVLTALYGLTRGEAALAALLVKGQSVEEAAAELFISVHTARTHLKRIFMKTDTHRQTELVVRMLMTVL